MAGWASNNNLKSNLKAVDGNDMLMGLVFPGSNKTVISSMDRICRMMGGQEEETNEDLNLYRLDSDNDKLELLKALRLSQTRAREAEKKAAILAKERDCLSDAFFEEAKELFAYRQLVRLLELQVSYLKSKCDSSMFMKEEDEEEDDRESIGRIVALALCLGIAGVGFAYGCRYLSSNF
ncbi:hypothetical protein FNV43_RR17516 [Rhamnella rubrinervis]|uniref:Uncharacterized protein n=1 Tax=Rhamnella rubrinervis TaxID=2594499 RepID=A0A8K0GVG6_9ROSA|nr:hypothetical protein FNV43_RR17516 [Rhamnella rubrinervis]